MRRGLRGATVVLQAYRPTEDVEGKQLAVLNAVVQALQQSAEQLGGSGAWAGPVRQAMARVLSCIISMEHRCVTGRMGFVCALMWEPADGDTGRTAAAGASPVCSVQHGCGGSLSASTAPQHGVSHCPRSLLA